ncbi:NUDIX hydrolase [Pararobbsia alpina]|uniref:Nudix hydrolase domain-containing protein n=1 Tax=Pararobbsia alpina TaxID=621374 RepID=A0A6S7BH02_9BURK|nr:DUF4743 domain-containing protein [Pararobbsia alpina]CAB3788306.1 hypothetical protein LMG28138_02582 [Pararobbsia alpina]
MRFPCLTAARRFEPSRHLPFLIGETQVGWIRRTDLPLLAGSESVFHIGPRGVELSRALTSVDARSRALGGVIDALAARGRITGWRNEIYAVRNRFDDPPLAFIERAASRFFGTQTFAAHLNGIVRLADAQAPQMWIARRSLSKATDPGMLDNLVGGGIGWGYGVEQTLYKECWEESGLPEDLARRAVRGGTLHVLQEIEEGTQAEQLFIFDLDLDADFVPRNQDGEVADHRLAGIAQVREWIADARMTVDASLAALDWMDRHEALDAGTRAELAGLATFPLMEAGEQLLR